MPTWGFSGVRELLFRRLYLTGEYVYGASKRGRKKNTKIRTKRAEADIIRVQRDEWKIVGQEAWDRAHARSGAGNGKARTQFVGKPEGSGKGVVYLLSSMLTCGALIPAGATRAHGGTECSAPLVVTSRGRSKVRAYVCSAHRERGDTVCTNNSAVPVEAIDRAVIASLKTAFSTEAFEQHLADRAADTVKIAQYNEERARLVDAELPRLAKVIERLTKRIAVIDDDTVADVLTAELKEAVQERKRVELRVAELTDYTVALNEQQNEVSRLREIWGSWVGCLNSDPEYIPKARQVLKKILGGVPICVRPLPGANAQDRRWVFAGLSRYDAVLAGGVTRDGYAVEHRPTRTPAEALQWYIEASGAAPRSAAPGGTTWSVGIAGDAPIIAGGSDADLEEDAHGGRPTSGPPCQTVV